MAALIAVLVFFLSVSEGCSQDFIHSGFSLTRDDLKEMISGLPPDAQEEILAKPEEFLEFMGKTLDGPQDLLLLVDKKNALPPGSVPPDLAALDEYPLTLTKKRLSLRLALIPDLLEMADAAKAQKAPLPLSSTYRSYDTQVTLYRDALKTKSREEVERELAPPGHSQHQLGTAIDFGSITLSFADTPGGRWLFANAWRFGFTLSFPKGKEKETGYSYEPWHYRYVGKPAAGLIHGFFDGSQQGFLEFYKNKSDAFRKVRVQSSAKVFTPSPPA
jgi:D-alanyl-D-alanine carboxypeptidase